MERVTPTAIYEKYRQGDNVYYNLHSLYASTRDGYLITLKAYETKYAPYNYDSMDALITTVLNFLKNNNYYTMSWKDFGLTFYNINWINIVHPYKIEQFGKRE